MDGKEGWDFHSWPSPASAEPRYTKHYQRAELIYPPCCRHLCCRRGGGARIELQSQVRLLHRGIYILRLCWEHLAANMSFSELLVHFEGEPDALKAVLADGSAAVDEEGEDILTCDITDQLLQSTAVPITSRQPVGSDCVTNTLQLVAVLFKTLQFRVR